MNRNHHRHLNQQQRRCPCLRHFHFHSTAVTATTRLTIAAPSYPTISTVTIHPAVAVSFNLATAVSPSATAFVDPVTAVTVLTGFVIAAFSASAPSSLLKQLLTLRRSPSLTSWLLRHYATAVVASFRCVLRRYSRPVQSHSTIDIANLNGTPLLDGGGGPRGARARKATQAGKHKRTRARKTTQAHKRNVRSTSKRSYTRRTPG